MSRVWSPKFPNVSHWGLWPLYTSRLSVLPSPLPTDDPSMPLKSKCSRSAKQKWQNAHAGFTKHVSSPSSPEGSIYCVLDSSSDTFMISEEESDDNEEVEASVEALQRLYAVFLPPHLRLKACSPEKLWKIKKQRLVYTGDLQTTRWQKCHWHLGTGLVAPVGLG